MHEAAQMAQWYMSHMLSKAQEMQDEETNLHEELGHLELALKDERNKLKKVEEKLQIEITRNYEITQQLDLSNGKVMGYQTQLTEMQYRIKQTQKDHAQEIEKINWQSSADLKVKDLQIEAMQRAQALMQQRLKQAEDAINEYMANPILDPTTQMGKDSQIKKLQEEVTIVKDMNIDLMGGYRSRVKYKDDEIDELKKQIA